MNAWIFGNAITNCLGLIHRRAGERAGLTGPENDILGSIEAVLQLSEVKVVRSHRLGPFAWSTQLEVLKPGVDDHDNSLVIAAKRRWTVQAVVMVVLAAVAVAAALLFAGCLIYQSGQDAGLHTGLLTKQLPTL